MLAASVTTFVTADFITDSLPSATELITEEAAANLKVLELDMHRKSHWHQKQVLSLRHRQELLQVDVIAAVTLAATTAAAITLHFTDHFPALEDCIANY